MWLNVAFWHERDTKVRVENGGLKELQIQNACLHKHSLAPSQYVVDRS